MALARGRGERRGEIRGRSVEQGDGGFARGEARGGGCVEEGGWRCWCAGGGLGLQAEEVDGGIGGLLGEGDATDVGWGALVGSVSVRAIL